MNIPGAIQPYFEHLLSFFRTSLCLCWSYYPECRVESSLSTVYLNSGSAAPVCCYQVLCLLRTVFDMVIVASLDDCICFVRALGSITLSIRYGLTLLYAMIDTFYQKMNLNKTDRSEIVILEDMDVRAYRLSSTELHLDLDPYRSENGERSLALCSEHCLSISSTNSESPVLYLTFTFFKSAVLSK